MLNKKLLAASIAATLSTSAFAAIDLDATDPTFDPVQYATQLTGSGETFAAVDAGSVLEVESKLGLAVSADVKRYVRVDLANATFADTAALTLNTASGTDTPSVVLVQGGIEDSNSAVFEISSDETIVQTDTVTVDMPELDVSNSADVAFTFRVYEGLTAATAGSEAALYTNEGNVIVTKSSAFDSDVISAGTSPEATVASGFENFTTGTDVDGTPDAAALGSFDFAGSLDGDVLDPTDSTAVAVADLYDATYTATVTGDVSFGDWYLSAADDCADKDVQLTENEAGTSAATAANAIARGAAKHYVCVEVANDNTDEEIVNKGEYSLTLTGSGDDEITGALASIDYDTVAVEVPYITTFEDYRQRIYMVNRSSNDVYYTTTFRTEGVARATAGEKAEGTIPAGEMIAVRASDMVSLVGRTRTAATIELEAVEGQVDISTQTVNLSNGTTDTVKLTD